MYGRPGGGNIVRCSKTQPRNRRADLRSKNAIQRWTSSTREILMQTVIVPSSRAANVASFAATVPGRILIGLGATVAVALAAHVAIPLPFTPVPLTLQPLAVLAVGLALVP